MIKKFFNWLQQLINNDKKTQSISSTKITVGLPSKSTNKLAAAHPKLQTAFRLIREYFRLKNPGMTLVLTEVYRSVSKQQRLYNQGRTTPGKIVTNVDGVNKKGKHNFYPSKAIDVMVKNFHTGKGTWEMKYYKQLPKLAKKVSKEVGYKITNGGTWKKLRDYPHLEVK